MRERQSNFELLRVFSMFLIILYHLVLYGIDREVFSSDFVYNFFYSGGKLGVALFIMITGYFIVKKDISFRKLFYLEGQVLFFSILSFIIYLFIGGENLDGYSLAKTFFPNFMNTYWFFSSYFALYLFLPFINRAIRGFHQKDFRKLLIIGFVFLILIPSLVIFRESITSSIYLLYYYLIGAYIRLFSNKKKYKRSYLLFGSVFSYLMIVLFSIVLFKLSFYNVYLGNYVSSFSGLQSIFVFVSSICIFLYFKDLNLKVSKVINLLGSVSFGVYLFHDHFLMRTILWKNLFRVSMFYESGMFFFYGIFVSVVVYFIAGIIEYVRKRIIDDKIMPILFQKCSESRIVKRVKNIVFG